MRRPGELRSMEACTSISLWRLFLSRSHYSALPLPIVSAATTECTWYYRLKRQIGLRIKNIQNQSDL